MTPVIRQIHKTLLDFLLELRRFEQPWIGIESLMFEEIHEVEPVGMAKEVQHERLVNGVEAVITLHRLVHSTQNEGGHVISEDVDQSTIDISDVLELVVETSQRASATFNQLAYRYRVNSVPVDHLFTGP